MSDTETANPTLEDYATEYDYADIDYDDEYSEPEGYEWEADPEEEAEPSPGEEPQSSPQEPTEKPQDDSGTTTPETPQTRISLSPDELQALMEGRLTEEETRGIEDHLMQTNELFQVGVNALNDERILIAMLENTSQAYLEGSPAEQREMLAQAKERTQKDLDEIRDAAKRDYNTQKVRQMEVRSRLDNFESSLASESMSPVRHLSDGLYQALVQDEMLPDTEEKRHAFNTILNGSIINIADLLGVPDAKIASALARSLSQSIPKAKALSAFEEKAAKIQRARGRAKSVAGSGMDGPPQQEGPLPNYDWFG